METGNRQIPLQMSHSKRVSFFGFLMIFFYNSLGTIPGSQDLRISESSSSVETAKVAMNDSTWRPSSTEMTEVISLLSISSD